MKFTNPSLDQIRDLLKNINTIAVVGLSPKKNRPSYQVSKAMQSFGYRIVPVRPAVEEVLGEKAYADLNAASSEIGAIHIDLVDVFRAPQHVGAIVDTCIALKIPAVWFQDGVVNETAAQRARDADITVIMDRCIYRDYLQLMR